MSIGNRAELTVRDATFIDTVTDLGARNIIYCLEYGQLSPPRDDMRIDDLLTKAHKSPKHHQPESIVPGLSAHDRILHGLRGLTGGNAGVRSYPHLSTHAQGFAATVMPFFGSMVAENVNGLQVDRYLAGNLQTLLAQYELHEPQDS